MRLQGEIYARGFHHPGIGGAYDLETHRIGINPLVLLFAPIDMVYQVIYHEGMHAGRVGGLSSGILDESITEVVTEKKLTEERRQSFTTGYDKLVEMLDPFVRGMSAEQLQELVDGNAHLTLQNFIQLIVLPEVIGAEDIHKYRRKFIEHQL